jgi:hypothetical protein
MGVGCCDNGCCDSLVHCTDANWVEGGEVIRVLVQGKESIRQGSRIIVWNGTSSKNVGKTAKYYIIPP